MEAQAPFAGTNKGMQSTIRGNRQQPSPCQAISLKAHHTDHQVPDMAPETSPRITTHTNTPRGGTHGDASAMQGSRRQPSPGQSTLLVAHHVNHQISELTPDAPPRAKFQGLPQTHHPGSPQASTPRAETRGDASAIRQNQQQASPISPSS